MRRERASTAKPSRRREATHNDANLVKNLSPKHSTEYHKTELILDDDDEHNGFNFAQQVQQWKSQME